MHCGALCALELSVLAKAVLLYLMRARHCDSPFNDIGRDAGSGAWRWRGPRAGASEADATAGRQTWRPTRFAGAGTLDLDRPGSRRARTARPLRVVSEALSRSLTRETRSALSDFAATGPCVRPRLRRYLPGARTASTPGV
jgi:hypothetical protein